MSEFKGTPGPWRVVPYDAGDRDEWPGTPSVQAPENLDCAIVHWAGFAQRYWQSARGLKEIEANARLIAAAPELLAFVQGFIEAWEDGMGGDSALYQDAKKLAAKALGEGQ